MYRGIDLLDPVRGDWSQQIDDMSPALRTTTVALSDYSRLSQSQQREARRSYYALISQVDAALGRLFARLHDMGLLANTWIIFTSDHGEMLGDHQLGSKLLHFEGSAHIPMLIRPPTGHALHQQKGTTCDRLVSLADILPTCLDVAGVSTDTLIDGQSLLDIHAKQAENRLHIGNCSDTYYMVMKDHWKYHWFANEGVELLFNLSDDRYEQTNLISDQSSQIIRAQLRHELIAHLQQYKPQLLTDELTLKPRSQPVALKSVMRFPGWRSQPETGLDNM